MQTQTPQLQTLPERVVVAASYTGNYMNNPAVFKDLFTKLQAWGEANNTITEQTEWISAYYNDPNVTPPEELKLDCCITVPADTEINSPDLTKKTMPGGDYIVMHCELEKPEEYGPAWMELVKYCQENNYQIDMSRPSYENYLMDPEKHPEKHHLVDMCMAVKK